MKKTLIFFAFVAISNLILAQINEVSGLNPNQVLGVYKDQNKALTLSNIEYRAFDSTTVYQISYLEEGDKRLSLEITKPFVLSEVIEATNQIYLLFWNGRNQALKIVSIKDAKITDKIISFSTNPKLAISYYQSYLMENDDLALTFDYRLDVNKSVMEIGYDLLFIDGSDLSEKGRYHEVIGEGNIRADIIEVLYTDQGCVFMREVSNYSSKNYAIDLLFLDSNFDEIKSELLTEEENTYIPSSISIVNGKVQVIGNYMFGSIFKSNKPEGMFVKTFDANGDNGKLIEYPWADLKTLLKENKKGRGDFVFDGKNKILIEGVVPRANGYLVICESYVMSSGFNASEFLMPDKTKEKMLTVYDFVLFHFSNENELLSVDLFQKEAMNIDLTRYGGRNYSSFLIAEQLKKAQIFPFQYFKEDEIHFITYKNQVGYFSKMDMNTGAIENLQELELQPEIEEEISASQAIINKSKFLSGLDKMGDKLDAVGNKIDYGLNKVDLSYFGGRSNLSGYILLKNKKKLVYLMNMERHSAFYEYVD